MKREKILHSVGFGLVGLFYLVAVFFVFHKPSEQNNKQIVIRIAHWQLEDGLRQAFDDVGREFTKLHPNVRIEQLVIPERIFPNWLITQLIGETAPDLIEIGLGIDDDRLARFFVPLTSLVDEPNPYNKGTPLESVPWRNTFLDGMYSAYNPTLLDYYSAGMTQHTIRLYYNSLLYETLMGTGAPPPRDFVALQNVFTKVAEYNRIHHTQLVTIAGSNYNGPIIMDQYLSSQSQKLQLRLNTLLDFSPTKYGTQIDFLLGRWSFESPELQSGLTLQHIVGSNLTKGFQSLRREDATFYFLQGHALMIASGSWDVRTLRSMASFPIEVSPVPLPSPQNPTFGAYTLGPFSETDESTTKFGLTRHSKHPKEAIEFLQFMTSQRGCQTFVNTSYWLPSVLGVKIPEPITEFAPIVDGYTQGIAFHNFGSDAMLVFTQNLYKLYNDHDPVTSFTQAIEPHLKAAVRRDLRQEIDTRFRNITRDDTTLAALLWKLSHGDNSEEIRSKAAALILNQHTMESDTYCLKTDLDSPAARQP
jgi:raffinose/stachyose/melibiose transport system substrate-binding protein